MDTMNKKSMLLQNLKLMKQTEQEAKNVFKVKAYKKVIDQIERIEAPILSLEDLKGVEGIGKSLKDKFETLFKEGVHPTTVDRMANVGKLEAIDLFSGIMAIGPVKARELVEVHKLRTLEDLQTRGMSLLNDKQRLGLHYHADFQLRIPRKEMQRHEAFVREVVMALDPSIRMEVTGSYRRQTPSSGDIDILVTHPDGLSESLFQTVIQTLRSNKYLLDDFAFGTKKYNGVCRLPRFKHARRIDIMVTPIEQFPFALLYFTGSQKFNIALRNHALSMQLSLNEYGLKHTDDKPGVHAKGEFLKRVFQDEKEVLAFLGVAYVPPEKREGTESLQLVEA